MRRILTSGLYIVLICLVLALLGYLFLLYQGSSPASSLAKIKPTIPEKASERVVKDAVYGEDYMIVTANPLATQAGAQILAAGGHVVDAMVASQLMLGLVEPQSSGIGGGAFVLYYDNASKQLSSWDGRETAPSSATPAWFLNDHGEPLLFADMLATARVIGVPGVIDLLARMHEKYGLLPWDTLFTAAIDRANNGFTVTDRLANSLQNHEQRLQQFPATRQWMYNDNNELLVTGDVLYNKQLAATYQLLANNGRDIFYNGSIAQQLINDIEELQDGRGITLDDLAGYYSKPRVPICTKIVDYKVCSMGPPSSGGVAVLQILGILERSNVQHYSPYSIKAEQLFIEAQRLAFADRNQYLADPDFVPVPLPGLLADDYLQQRAALLRTELMVRAKAGQPSWQGMYTLDTWERPSTTHLVMVDKYGNALSMTSSIEHAFGSGLMSGGFFLNNQLTDFSFSPVNHEQVVANRIEPIKRPRSSMAPTIVFASDDSPLLLIGSPGGADIISYVARALSSILFWDYELITAIERDHIVHRGDILSLEQGTASAARYEDFKDLGYQVQVRDMPSGLAAIMRYNNKWLGVADSRREGSAQGDL